MEKNKKEKRVAHVHRMFQISANTFERSFSGWKNKKKKKEKERKQKRVESRRVFPKNGTKWYSL